MTSTQSFWKNRVAFAADIVFLLLSLIAVLIALQSGVRWRLGSLHLTAKSAVRSSVFAVLVLILRHSIVPRPSLAARVFTPLRRLRARGTLSHDRVSTVVDTVVVTLTGLALLVDLVPDLRWHPGRAPIVLPSGAYFVLAAFGGVLLRRTLLRRVPSLSEGLRARCRRSELRFEAPSLRAVLWAVLLFAGATALMLREQIRAYTSVPDLGDPLFSMWRLAWVAHQLPLDPRHLFDANIFHPAARTLAYSDAMLLPAVIGAPALWLGAPLAAVYTSLLLLSYVSAGVAMFVLAHAVTRCAGAAVIAGLIFAFDPFRFAHYSHLELQFTFGMPLAVLFLLRGLATGSRRDGVLAGIFVALQFLASLYYGAYLTLSLVVLVICWVSFVNLGDRRTVASLGLSLAIAAAVCLPVSLPYWANRTTVGERGPDEVRSFSATGRDYFTAHRQSAVYGTWLWYPSDGERKLFPGTLPLVLGAAALLPPFEPIVAVTAVTLAVSVDASLGLHGTIYQWLYDFLPPFRGFRVPARFRAIAGLYLALLAGVAAAALRRNVQSAWRGRAALSALAVLLLIDVHPNLALQPVWNHAPGIYRLIPDRRAVLADLPLPWDQDPFWHDPVYVYFSTFHWHPIINGSSGFTPRWYDRLGSLSRDFPSDETLNAYRRLGTEYFVLHEGYYGAKTFQRVVSDIEAQPRLQFVATVMWEEGECRLYRLLR